jgi:hypothetical protein
MFKHELLPAFDMPDVTVDGRRHYTTPNGDVYPSVTTVLGEKLDKSFLVRWKERVGEEEARKISTMAKNRGKIVHTEIENLLLNKPNAGAGLMPLYAPLFQKMKPIYQRHIDVVYGIEYPLWSDTLHTAGRTDLYARWDNERSIVDLKGSNKPKKREWITSYFLQTATYAIMVEERTGVHVPQLVVAVMVDHDEPQIFVERTENWRQQVVDLFVPTEVTTFFEK